MVFHVWEMKFLLAGSVGVFVGDLSGNLTSQSEKLISASQQCHILHTKLCRSLIHRQLFRIEHFIIHLIINNKYCYVLRIKPVPQASNTPA